MDKSIEKQLKWIDGQLTPMVQLLKKWSDINSASDNLVGLDRMLHAIQKKLTPLADTVSVIPLPPRFNIDNSGQPIKISHGNALHAVKRSKAPMTIFLGGHMDTVFAVDHPFQKATIDLKNNRLFGPGVADMKGGLIIMLTALQAFEQTPHAEKIGWEVVVNPDEEVGSVGSTPLLVECAQRSHYALLFEPSFPDGAMVDTRKGSMNLAVVVLGKAAHAGRDFHQGKSAITALAKFIVEAEKLTNPDKEITVNIGHINGGGPINIVPALAVCHINVRAKTESDYRSLQKKLETLAAKLSIDTPIQVHTLSSRAPKLWNKRTKRFFDMLQTCCDEERLPLKLQSSGGVCDGNTFAEHGVPTIDSLGVIGGSLHTDNEFMVIDSLAVRARLTLRLLSALAQHSPTK